MCVTPEKLEAEFGERLARLGPKANAASLASLLNEVVSGSASLPQPSSARAAHVLIIAALNLVRVEAAPLPRPQDLSPLAFLLAQQQVYTRQPSLLPTGLPAPTAQLTTLSLFCTCCGSFPLLVPAFLQVRTEHSAIVQISICLVSRLGQGQLPHVCDAMAM